MLVLGADAQIAEPGTVARGHFSHGKQGFFVCNLTLQLEGAIYRPVAHLAGVMRVRAKMDVSSNSLRQTLGQLKKSEDFGVCGLSDRGTKIFATDSCLCFGAGLSRHRHEKLHKIIRIGPTPLKTAWQQKTFSYPESLGPAVVIGDGNRSSNNEADFVYRVARDLDCSGIAGPHARDNATTLKVLSPKRFHSLRLKRIAWIPGPRRQIRWPSWAAADPAVGQRAGHASFPTGANRFSLGANSIEPLPVTVLDAVSKADFHRTADVDDVKV
jgi:hypothetical protein